MGFIGKAYYLLLYRNNLILKYAFFSAIRFPKLHGVEKEEPLRKAWKQEGQEHIFLPFLHSLEEIFSCPLATNERFLRWSLGLGSLPRTGKPRNEEYIRMVKKKIEEL